VGLSASLSVIVALWIVFELVHQPLRVCKLSRINAVLAEAASAERAGREGSVYSLSFNLAPSIGPNNGRNMTGDTKGALPKISAKKFERMEWDPNLRERKTITDYLATALRTAIYDGQFADNEELNQVELAEFFGVSRVPIREALRQLQAEGLVQNIAHHRTIVSGMKLPQILEAIEMRAVLEAHLLAKSAPHLTKEDLDKLGKICAETDRIKDYGARWVLKNWEFHRTLYSRSESPAIISTVERVQLNIERYARRAGSRDRLQQAATEHRQILSLVAKRDFAKASELLETHILHTGVEIQTAHNRTTIQRSGKLADKKLKRLAVAR
jgi:DNA-binding GntR family transcriptional regulator